MELKMLDCIKENLLTSTAKPILATNSKLLKCYADHPYEIAHTTRCLYTQTNATMI